MIEWLPTARLGAVRSAVPDVSSAAEPSTAAPSRKVTVPLGLPLPAPVALTAAEKVIAAPEVAGFAEEESVVLVSAWVTTSEREPASLAANPASR